MTFADVKVSVRIEEVASRYIELRRQGGNFVARCPFHEDQGRPNLVIFTGTQTFKCFACGAMGDVIDFVARMEHVKQGEAAKKLEQQGLAPAAPGGSSGRLSSVPVNVTKRDLVYQAMLNGLELSPEHQQNLLGRGLGLEAIEANGYRSLGLRSRDKITVALRRAGFDLRGIPGFAVDVRDQRWRLFGPPGLLIPVRNLKGQIMALQVRSDQSDDRRYRWLSTPETERRIEGASSGAPCHVAGRAFLNKSRTLWVTEGPLKADIAAYRLSAGVLGVPGVANWRKVVPLLKLIKPQVVILAFDQDSDPKTRQAVERGVESARQAIRHLARRVSEATWRSGKGLDDALLQGVRIQVH